MGLVPVCPSCNAINVKQHRGHWCCKFCGESFTEPHYRERLHGRRASSRAAIKREQTARRKAQRAAEAEAEAQPRAGRILIRGYVF